MKRKCIWTQMNTNTWWYKSILPKSACCRARQTHKATFLDYDETTFADLPDEKPRITGIKEKYQVDISKKYMKWSRGEIPKYIYLRNMKQSSGEVPINMKWSRGEIPSTYTWEIWNVQEEKYQVNIYKKYETIKRRNTKVYICIYI